MKLIGNVDVSPPAGFSGWVADLEQPDESLVVLVISEGEVVATCLANHPRPDLAPILSNTNKGFSLDLGTSSSTSGRVEVRVFPASYLSSGEHFTAVGVPSALERSQTRWRGDEEASGLTWGMMMSGGEFFSQVANARGLDGGLGRLIELGPGYGRLLQHVLDCNLSFSSYLGIDLSTKRVKMLTKKFGAPNIKFIAGDIMKFDYSDEFDTLICSSTIEHLYPDASTTLLSIGKTIAKGGHVFIDFPRHEDGENFKSRNFEPGQEVFVRYYAREEVRCLYERAGLTLIYSSPYQMRGTNAPAPTNSESTKDGGWVYQGDRPVAVARFMAVGRRN